MIRMYAFYESGKVGVHSEHGESGYPRVSSAGRSSLGSVAPQADEPLQIVSIADRVYAVVRERILNGELEAGSRIHQENVSEELGVSRTPVREALARLAADGLVQLLPNRGARVAEVTLDDIRTAYEARLAVEPLAARFAAERREPADLKRMRATVKAQRRARGARTAFTAIRDFHLAIVDTARNPLLSRFAASLWAGRIGLHAYLRQADEASLAADADEHEGIVRAVELGDAAEAERLMDEHIAISLERLVEATSEPEPAASPSRG
jgi:DNA-binding GntR family transcriptional regulator